METARGLEASPVPLPWDAPPQASLDLSTNFGLVQAVQNLDCVQVTVQDLDSVDAILADTRTNQIFGKVGEM
jgi:hypothetical protein